MRVTADAEGPQASASSSTVGIETDPQWEAVRDAWKYRTGSDGSR